jgi:hypothetical protein
MDHDYSILAVFVPARYTLTTEAIGMGTIQRDLQQADYGYGDIVTLTAVPLPGWLFVEWVGDITGTAPELTVTIHTNKTVNALFIQEEYPLTTHVTGNGSILQDPNMALYPSGSLVSLSAEPDTAWYFDHWEGDLTGSENTPTLTMTTPKDVTAVFSEMAAITTDTLGTGTVQVTPDQNYYLPTDTPILQADPAPGWRFDRWEGDVFVADYANSAQLTLSPVLSSRQITAVFIQKFTLLLSSQGEGSLSMEPGPYWLDAGTTGNITATPALGWHFVEWSGSYTGSESVTSYVMDGNKTVTATFAPDEYASPLYMLIEGRGSVQAVPDKPSYLQGESVILTAVPASSGSAFY